MPEYTLQELEDMNLGESKERFLFGNTVAEMKKSAPDRTVKTWCEVHDAFKDHLSKTQ